jgi:hypothetical protein
MLADQGAGGTVSYRLVPQPTPPKAVLRAERPWFGRLARAKERNPNRAGPPELRRMTGPLFQRAALDLDEGLSCMTPMLPWQYGRGRRPAT